MYMFLTLLLYHFYRYNRQYALQYIIFFPLKYFSVERNINFFVKSSLLIRIFYSLPIGLQP